MSEDMPLQANASDAERSPYRQGLPPRPPRMARLPLDARGFPVPWFVAYIDGEPDFRVIRENGIALAHNHKTCWLCGEPLGRYGAFVIGPMCGINRTISEPPSHRECAEYAAIACPFMTTPQAVRNQRGLDAFPNKKDAAGHGIKRNPGVACVWVTREWRPFRVGNGHLFTFGDPTHIAFYAKGRAATRAEVEHSVDTGIHHLSDMAEAEGPAAVAALSRMRKDFEKLLPPRCQGDRSNEPESTASNMNPYNCEGELTE